jgi:UPF0755 protein
VLFLGNTKATDDDYFYIRTDDSYELIRSNLIHSGIIENEQTFDLVAKQMNLPNTYKAGRYKIPKGMSNVNLVRKIRSGKWDKVVLKLMPEMSRNDVLDYLASNLQANREEIDKAMSSKWVEASGFTNENKWCIFLPDHYLSWQ